MKKKQLQIQFGISVKHVSIDLIIDNEGIHLYVDTEGDVSQEVGCDAKGLYTKCRETQ